MFLSVKLSGYLLIRALSPTLRRMHATLGAECSMMKPLLRAYPWDCAGPPPYLTTTVHPSQTTPFLVLAFRLDELEAL